MSSLGEKRERRAREEREKRERERRERRERGESGQVLKQSRGGLLLRIVWEERGPQHQPSEKKEKTVGL
tara:strand:+ start:464 stop:670 length:207 start_codon:yes stop_codon:yes gene_type:complete